MKINHDHWKTYARYWQHVGPPLRPGPGDIRLAEALVAEGAQSKNNPFLQAILLGVTPEIALMNWPSKVNLLAVDHCLEMILWVWTDPSRSPASAICSDWKTLPVFNAAADIVIGDGCYTVLKSPEEYESVSREIRRVLKPTGSFIMRFFVQPEQPESTEAVFADLRDGRIGNFHIFKWRLAMSLHEKLEDGVRLGDIWEAWHNAGMDADLVSKHMNWPPEAVSGIEVYRDVDTRYTFPKIEELTAALDKYFVRQGCYFPDCELGERCPVLHLKPRLIGWS